MLTWNEIQEMMPYNITFGSHTLSHSLLGHIDEHEAVKEIEESKRCLEQKLKCDVRHFAFPGYSYTYRLLECVEAAGYETAFVYEPTHQVRNTITTPPRQLRRIGLQNMPHYVNLTEISGVLLSLRRIVSRCGLPPQHCPN